MKEELGESVGHFRQAANHAAGGVGATVGPRVSAARDRVSPAAGKMKSAAAISLGSAAAALAPMAVSAKDAGRKAKRKSAKALKREKPTRRWPKMATLLAAGAAVGAAGALVMRRRRRQQWEEYDPSRPIESTGTAPETTPEAAEPTMAGTRTTSSGHGLSGTSATTGMATPVSGSTTSGPAGTASAAADELISRSGSSSNNSRG